MSQQAMRQTMYQQNNRVYTYRVSPNTCIELIRFSQNAIGDCVAEHDFCKLLDDGGKERKRCKSMVRRDKRGELYFLSFGSRIYLADCRRKELS